MKEKHDDVCELLLTLMPLEGSVPSLEACGTQRVATPSCMPPREALNPRCGTGTFRSASRAAVMLPGLEADFTAPKCKLMRSIDNETAWAVTAVEDRAAA